MALCVFLKLWLRVSISLDNKTQCFLCLTLYTEYQFTVPFVHSEVFE